MSAPVPDVVRAIASRAPHEAAFGELVRRIDAQPAPDAAALADAIAPSLEAWPTDARRLTLGPGAVLGPAARRLTASLALHWVAGDDHALLEGLGEMPLLVSAELLPLDKDAARWIRRLPTRVRQVGLLATPARREAEAWAATTAAALERLDALDGIALSVGPATPHLADRLVDRPLASFDTRIAELAGPALLERLDPSRLRALHLHAVDGVPPAWTPAAIGAALPRMPGLVALSCPWMDPAALEGARALERLTVTPIGGLEPDAPPRLLTSLPPTLRRLGIPGLPGDLTLAAFARCPALHEMSWLNNRFSRAGVRALLATDALHRLTRIELNGALERPEARLLFEKGTPAQLRHLDLRYLDLGDAVIGALARSTPWLAHLVSLDVPRNGLSNKGLVALLDALLEHAPDLVALSVADNRPGEEAHERLRQLHARGVAIDVELPAARKGSTSAAAPAAAVTAAWAKLEAALAASGPAAPRLAPPARAAALAAATHLPPSLRALYASHDAGEGAELLGLGPIVWWPLADLGAEDLVERDERAFAVFAAPLGDAVEATYEPGELPAVDDELDEVLAIATDTEEVVVLGRKGALDVVAEHLGAAMEAVAEALASGTRIVDENGRLAEPDAAPPRVAPVEASRASVLDELAAALVARHVVELLDGTTASDLARALEEAASVADAKARRRAVLAVFDSDVVDEVFVGDDELEAIAAEIARHLG